MSKGGVFNGRGSGAFYRALLSSTTMAILGSQFDDDATVFFSAAGITDATQKDAVNDLVVALKAASIWTKMKAIYPMVGGTATTNKYNLKDPRDLDAAYRLTFSGTWTHASTGSVPTATTSYADSYLVPSTALSQDSAHVAYYMRTNSPSGTQHQMGSTNAGFSGLGLSLNNGGIAYAFANAAFDSLGTSASFTSSTGMYLLSRTASGTYAAFQPNGAKTPKTQASSYLSTFSVYVASINVNGSAFTSAALGQECSFASIGDGLSDADVSALYTAVSAYQTALGR